MPSVAELTARMLDATDQAPAGRPPVVRTVFYVCFAGALGSFLAMIALYAPRVFGVATFPSDGDRVRWFDPHTSGALLADFAALGVFVWACGLTVRFCLGWVWDEEPPAWTPTALTLAAAGLLAAGTGITTPAAGALAALALRYTAYRADGSIRPDPLRPPSRASAVALGLALPVFALSIATAYAISHPLKARWWSSGMPLKASRDDAEVLNPIIENTGGRPVRILAIEPGEEHGYALHLSGVRVQKRTWVPPAPRTLPFRPFTLAPHAERDDLVLRISRAGCRPGQSGRVDSVRVRYALGGERSTLLKLSEPLTLSC
jgi:hypothetical protein